MAGNQHTQSEHKTAPLPPWSSLVSLVQGFDLRKFFPWTSSFAADNRGDVGLSREEGYGGRGSESSSIGQKPELVTAEKPTPSNPPHPPPLKVEADDPARVTNPLVVFPVYAIGGFIVLKWVLARWKERQERAKKPDDDDNPSTEEFHEASADDED